MSKESYRSKIDKLVCESGLKGSAVAREMGVSVDRIIALRRGKDENISSDDFKSCVSAIARLGGDIPVTQHRSIEERLSDIEAKLDRVVKMLGEQNAYPDA